MKLSIVSVRCTSEVSYRYMIWCGHLRETCMVAPRKSGYSCRASSSIEQQPPVTPERKRFPSCESRVSVQPVVARPYLSAPIVPAPAGRTDRNCYDIVLCLPLKILKETSTWHPVTHRSGEGSRCYGGVFCFHTAHKNTHQLTKNEMYDIITSGSIC